MKATTRNAKKAAAALKFDGTIVVNRNEITVWVNDLDYDAAETVAWSLAKTFGNCSVTTLGSRFQVNYKSAPISMGDYMDQSSRWHY